MMITGLFATLTKSGLSAPEPSLPGRQNRSDFAVEVEVHSVSYPGCRAAFIARQRGSYRASYQPWRAWHLRGLALRFMGLVVGEANGDLEIIPKALSN